ncbi:MAG TPA: cytochrome c peroxidase, partial [Kofleriaceae bacterium]
MVSVGGCWAEEPLIHGAFTADQWAHLQNEFAPPTAPEPCDKEKLPLPAGGRPYDCDGAARFGQQLFFEPLLSGPKIFPDPKDESTWFPAANTACTTCHATAYANADKTPAWYTDIRSSNAVSQGALNPTPHNTMSLVNVDVGERTSFGWTGECGGEPCDTANDVVNKIALPKAMQSNAEVIGRAIRNTPHYLATYFAVFGVDAATTDAFIKQNVELALGAYMRRLVSIDAPFDDFIRGNDAAMDDAAKRGFALFVGRAMCAECHRGPLFTDDGFHVTGVWDAGFDPGRAGTGKFYTTPLRNVEKTAPYMHKGTLDTLGDVIDFYRAGGHDSGYTGHRSPLMQPFEITPEEAKDLEAFLRSLTA